MLILVYAVHLLACFELEEGGFNCILQKCVKLQTAIKKLFSSSLKGLAFCQSWECVSDCPCLTVPLALLGPSVTIWGAGRACVTVMGEFRAANAEVAVILFSR